MLTAHLPSRSPAPSKAALAIGHVWPMAALNTCLRCLELRNVTGTFPKGHQLRRVAITADPIRSREHVEALNDMLYRYASASIAGQVAGVVDQDVNALFTYDSVIRQLEAASIADLSLIASAFLSKPRQNVPIRRSLGGELGPQSITQPFGTLAIEGDNALSVIGDLPDNDWLPFPPGGSRGNESWVDSFCTPLARWIAYLEWPHIRAVAALEKALTIDNKLAGILKSVYRAGMLRTYLELQGYIVALRPYARLILAEPFAVSYGQQYGYGSWTYRAKAAERVLRFPLSPLAHLVDPGEPVARQVRGKRMDVHLLPGFRTTATVAGALPREVQAGFDAVDDLLSDATTMAAMRGIAQALGHDATSPYPSLSGVVDVDMWNARYLRTFEVSSEIATLRDLPYVLLRNPVQDSWLRARTKDGSGRRDTRVTGTDLRQRQRPVELSIQDGHPEMRGDDVNDDVLLAAMTALDYGQGEAPGYAGLAEFAAPLHADVETIAAVTDIPIDRIEAAIAENRMPFAFTESGRPLSDYLYVSDHTINRALHATAVIPDARPQLLYVYDSRGEQASDRPLGIGQGTYRLDSTVPSMAGDVNDLIDALAGRLLAENQPLPTAREVRQTVAGDAARHAVEVRAEIAREEADIKKAHETFKGTTAPAAGGEG